tara:strand:- start:36 stop:1124 length:1089 start_codon:yes stop_codon:yes gene_type:complete
MTNKVAIAADTHFGVQGKLDDILWSVKVMREYCRRADINTVIIAGDLFHDRKSIDVEVMSKTCDFFEETKEKYGQQWIAFPGNHDMFLRHSWRINSLHAMRKHMTIIEDVKILKINDTRFWVLPFITYEKSYMRVLDKINEQHQEGDVLLTHIGIKGATLNSCFLLKDWSIVSFEDSPFRRVYTGHFHCKQQVNDNVWYPGSLIPFKFDEGNIPHGFYVYDLDENDHKFINIWKAGEKFFPNETPPPQFLTITDDIIDQITNEDVAGNLVRIALSQDYANSDKQEFKDHMMSLGAKAVRWLQLKEKQTIVKPKEIALSNDDLFATYVESDKTTKDLNLKILKKLNEEIIKEGDGKYATDNML